MTPHLPRLPRTVETDPRHDAVRRRLLESTTPLSADAPIEIPSLAPTAPLREALEAAGRAGQVERGLETISASLAGEARGLRAAGLAGAARTSRLLLLSDDGSERFYRQVASMLREHGHRVLALRLRCDAGGLGSMLFGGGTAAKAACVSRKAAVAAILLTLAESPG